MPAFRGEFLQVESMSCRVTYNGNGPRFTVFVNFLANLQIGEREGRDQVQVIFDALCEAMSQNRLLSSYVDRLKLPRESDFSLEKVLDTSVLYCVCEAVDKQLAYLQKQKK